MKRLLIILPFLTQATFAQVDSLTYTSDSLSTSFNHKLDSIEGSFNKQAASLKQSYGQTKSRIESLKSTYQQKLDSLSHPKLPSEKYTNKIDSLNNLKPSTDQYTKKIDSLNSELMQVQQKTTSKIDSLKNQITDKIKSLKVPPQAEGKVSELTSSLDKLNLPTIDAEIENKIGLDKLNRSVPALATPALNTNGLPGVNLPTTNATVPSGAIPGNGIQDKLGDANSIQDKLGGVAGKAEGIQQRIKEGVSAEKAEQVVTDKVSQLDQVKSIKDQTVPEVLPGGLPATEDEAKEQLKDMAKKEAINHFAGKEASLQQAMDKMSKYKKRYSNLESLKDLPKKAPNPMKGKPFIERIVPGVAFQILKRDNFLLDIAPYIGYKFSGKLTVGAGWNQRASFNSENPAEQIKVYGPRVYGEYKVFKGISGRLELETMNAFVPQELTVTDVGHREWVPAVLAGMKQEYKVYKNLRGTALILYNFYNPNYKSPYGDRMNVRFGFEYAFKKRKKETVKK